MDTSYVAVGTAMYMITDSLTCPPKKALPERGSAFHRLGDGFALALTQRLDRNPGQP